MQDTIILQCGGSFVGIHDILLPSWEPTSWSTESKQIMRGWDSVAWGRRYMYIFISLFHFKDFKNAKLYLVEKFFHVSCQGYEVIRNVLEWKHKCVRQLLTNWCEERSQWTWVRCGSEVSVVPTNVKICFQLLSAPFASSLDSVGLPDNQKWFRWLEPFLNGFTSGHWQHGGFARTTSTVEDKRFIWRT